MVKLKDAAYQERLDSQRAYWERLKAEVAAARQRGYENTQIVAMSETYLKWRTKRCLPRNTIQKRSP